ncbi:phage tail protein [Pseudomonas sp. BGM005]|nr:phage tail protein [Pseudomonas sp. BG5]
MGASITLAGESLIAQKHVAQLGLEVRRFIFANVPGLDPSGPVDRAASKPVAGQIVHVYDIPEENAGFVNPNQVVYSSQIGSDVGDWDFNWIGLETAEGVLFAVAYVPLQIKRRNIPPLQIGNNLTRNFLVAFDGAQALTGITIDAATWQHDFTVRLAGIDERERVSNRDIYGRACFFGAALQLEKLAGTYQIQPGTAYVEGVRVVRSAALPVMPAEFPCTAWLEVALQRELSDVVASWQVVFAADRPDYTDSAGTRHYCVAIADLPNANTIIDRRTVEQIEEPLVRHFAARVGDYPHLRARGTTKEDVGLPLIPNALSDDWRTDDSQILATTKAVAQAVATNYTGPLIAGQALTASMRGVVLLDANTQAQTYTLPPANAATGVIDLIIRRVDNSRMRLRVQGTGTDRILFHTHLSPTGYPFLLLMGAGDWWHLRSDGKGQWWPIGRADSTALGRPLFDTTMTFPPGGYGPINGDLLARAEWPWLWDLARTSGMLTTEAGRVGMEGGWTSGDEVSTFRIPEIRGEFLRYLDENRGVDVGRGAGSSQRATRVANSPGQYGVDLPSNNWLDSVEAGEDMGIQFVTPTINSRSNISAARVRVRNIAYPGRLKVI